MSIWSKLASNLTDILSRSGEATMGDIGALGDIAFTVSSYNDIFTFSDYTRQANARFAEHEVIGGKSLIEFLGTNANTITLSIKLHASWGVNPRQEVARLIEYLEKGEVLPLVLASEPVGNGWWVLESLSESHIHYDLSGVPIYIQISIGLKEYVTDDNRDS